MFPLRGAVEHHREAGLREFFHHPNRFTSSALGNLRASWPMGAFLEDGFVDYLTSFVDQHRNFIGLDRSGLSTSDLIYAFEDNMRRAAQERYGERGYPDSQSPKVNPQTPLAATMQSRYETKTRYDTLSHDKLVKENREKAWQHLAKMGVDVESVKQVFEPSEGGGRDYNQNVSYNAALFPSGATGNHYFMSVDLPQYRYSAGDEQRLLKLFFSYTSPETVARNDRLPIDSTKFDRTVEIIRDVTEPSDEYVLIIDGLPKLVVASQGAKKQDQEKQLSEVETTKAEEALSFWGLPSNVENLKPENIRALIKQQLGQAVTETKRYLVSRQALKPRPY